MNDIFKYQPNIGAGTDEPSIETLIMLYYLKHFSPEEAKEYTEKYIRKSRSSQKEYLNSIYGTSMYSETELAYIRSDLKKLNIESAAALALLKDNK
jgi:hypothetical protein